MTNPTSESNPVPAGAGVEPLDAWRRAKRRYNQSEIAYGQASDKTCRFHDETGEPGLNARYCKEWDEAATERQKAWQALEAADEVLLNAPESDALARARGMEAKLRDLAQGWYSTQGDENVTRDERTIYWACADEMLAIVAAPAGAPSPEVGPWVSCKERMPEDDLTVLVKCSWKGDFFTAFRDWEQGHDPDHWRSAEGQRYEMEDITHWMPIPPLPPAARDDGRGGVA